MATVSDAQAPAAPSQGFKFPTAYTILFALIAVVAAATEAVLYGFVLLMLGIPAYVWQVRQQSAVTSRL